MACDRTAHQALEGQGHERRVGGKRGVAIMSWRFPGRRMRERLVVVGNGPAAMRTVEELLLRAPDRYDIAIFGAEPRHAYNRILLSSVLSGEKSADGIVTHDPTWHEERGIALVAGDPIVAIDRAAQSVTSASGIVMGYDTLLLATGSKPIALPVPGLGLPGVTAFRDMDDVERMIAAASTASRAVVIGGGLLGLEAAWGLRRRGMAVTLVHLMPTLMERQLDATAAGLLRRALEARGIDFVTNAQTEEVIGGDCAEGIRLADGSELPGDLVVMAIGTRPNIDLARAAELDINRGILVGDDMRSSDLSIYAVGECVEHNGRTFGLVAPLWEQAKVCAARLAGDWRAAYQPPPLYTSLKITGIDVFSAGAIAPAEDEDDLVTLSDAALGVYRKLVLRGDVLVGCVLYGDVRDGPWYVELIQSGESTARWRDHLVFGRGAAEQGAESAPQPAEAA
jgi:nitrite reductase (NADH) large subunit